MRRLLLLLPLIVGFCTCNFLQGGRFLEKEPTELRTMEHSQKGTYLFTALEDGLRTIVGTTVGNTFLSDAEMVKKLDDEWVKRGTEEFYAILELRSIVKKLDKWIEQQGWTPADLTNSETPKPKAEFVRDEFQKIIEKRMVCNRYEGSAYDISKGIGHELYNTTFQPEILSLVENVYFDCSRIIDIVGSWLLSLTKEPPQTRVATLFRHFGDVRNKLYSEIFDYGVERDFINAIRGEYDDQTMKAFQLYYEQKTETKMYGSGKYRNVTQRLQTFEKSYFQTLPKEISEQLPKIYERIAKKRQLNSETRFGALSLVKEIPSQKTKEQKYDLFIKTFPLVDKKSADQYISWVRIYQKLDEDFGAEYSVSILNDFRALLLRDIFNSLHGILNEGQRKQEFDALVEVIVEEKGSINKDLLRELMKKVYERKDELFNEVEAGALGEALSSIIFSNNTIADKIKEISDKVKELGAEHNTIMQLALPILYIQEYEDIYNVRYGENLTAAVKKYNSLILAKKITNIFKAHRLEKATDKTLIEVAKFAHAEFEMKKSRQIVEDIQKSVELDFAGQFGISAYPGVVQAGPTDWAVAEGGSSNPDSYAAEERHFR